MRKLVIFLLVLSFSALAAYTQNLNNLDFIAPFHENVAAIKKGNQWSFIDADGKLLFNFRDDLVSTDFDEKSYPVYKDDRCLVKLVKKGITYFGYIDKKGKTIVEPQFLNATNFNKGKAIVLKLETEQVGETSNVLGQRIVEHSYVNVLINTQGEFTKYLSDWKKISLSSKIIKKPPIITTKLLSDELYALYENNKWKIIKLDK